MLFEVSGKDLGASVVAPETTRNVLKDYGAGFAEYLKEVGLALSPIAAFFLLFQLFTRAFTKRQAIKVGVGLIYTFVGLTLFLTGANVGFMPVGAKMGETLAEIAGGWSSPSAQSSAISLWRRNLPCMCSIKKWNIPARAPFRQRR